MRYAIIKGGVVISVTLWDGVTAWSPPPGTTAVNINAQPSVDIGYTYNGSVFTAPAGGRAPQPETSNVVNGSVAFPIDVFTQTATLDGRYYTCLIRGGAGAFSIALPDAASCPGRIYVFSRLDATVNNTTLTLVTGTDKFFTTVVSTSVIITGLGTKKVFQSAGSAGYWVQIG